ncbi:hypothetical protein CTI12_AA236030 [Artemisia annua]|uniref:Uncharacterized protein n=1 Tax=Artemisia annua TaxID=35608 RepID=A0A2U1NS95_ARTAN|nr:hypothetical protein CTI12_AA236030 [Artemisia annua]
MKPVDVKVIRDGYEDTEGCGEQYCKSLFYVLVVSFRVAPCMGLMKNYKFRSWKVLEALVKVLVAGIEDMVLKTISVTVWIMKTWRLCYDSKEEFNLYGEVGR